MRDDFEDLPVEERLADTVQHDPLEDGELLRDGLDLLQREVGRRLEAPEGADARLTFRIAAVGRLEIERPRQRGDHGESAGGGQGPLLSAPRRPWCRRWPSSGDPRASSVPSRARSVRGGATGRRGRGGPAGPPPPPRR